MGSGRPLTCHRSESSASGSATMNSAEDPLCGMTSGAGKFRASARAGTRVRMRCATRAIPRRSVLNVQMLRLWDDRLHFVISPVIIVSGPLSPLFQLTTATSVTSTRAPSLSRFLPLLPNVIPIRITMVRHGSPSVPPVHHRFDPRSSHFISCPASSLPVKRMVLERLVLHR